MSSRVRVVRTPTLILSLLAMAGSMATTFAADAPAAQPPAPSKEMRAKMATLHEQMAACLRSDKPFDECRTEMMKGCQSIMGAHGCPMMGMGGMQGMMQMPSPSADTPK